MVGGSRVILFFILTLLLIVAFGGGTGAESPGFELPFAGELLLQEKAQEQYLFLLEELKKGELQHPEAPRPEYSILMEGKPQTYIRPLNFMVSAGSVEKNTWRISSDWTPAQVAEEWKEKLEKMGAEIFFQAGGEEVKLWTAWYQNHYPHPARKEIFKSLQPVSLLSAGLAGEKYISSAFLTGAEETIIQLDIVRPQSSAVATALNSEIPILLDYYNVSGVSLALIEEGDITFLKAFGYADQEQEEVLTLNHFFRVGSLTKPVVAWGVMRLVEEGLINLDDPVEKHLDRWQFPPDSSYRDQVTVRKLLGHTAGLPAGIGGGYAPGEPLPSLEDILSGRAGMTGLRIERSPGTSFLYSNPGYVLLELLIEEVTGMKMGQFLVQEVLKPLGTVNATFSWSPGLQEQMSTGYNYRDEPVAIELDAAAAPGGLYASTPDLARFTAAWINEDKGSRVLQQKSREQLFTPMVEAGSFYGLMAEFYGLGHFIETLPTGEKAVFHSGQHGGWLASAYGVPSTGDGIVILSNSERSQHLIARLLGLWAETAGYESVQMSRTYAGAALLLQGLQGLFLVLTLGGLLFYGIGTIKGQRVLAPLLSRGIFWRMAQFLAALLLIFLVIRGAEFKMVRVFLPKLSENLGLTLLALATIMLMGSLLPRRQ